MTRTGPRLPRTFFARSSTEVAPDLLGRVLVRRLPTGERVSVRLVETEAYQEGDPASHSYRGLTPRTEVMFGPPGRVYVYFTYGMHFCMNVVTGREGEGSAVLLRAAEPLTGIATMRRLRGVEDLRQLCSGPARLCEALGVGRAENGIDLVRGSELRMHEGEPVEDDGVGVSSRVGITAGMERPWRFYVLADAFVSRARPATLTGSP